MSNVKISQLPNGGNIQNTDEIPVVRANANFKAQIANRQLLILSAINNNLVKTDSNGQVQDSGISVVQLNAILNSTIPIEVIANQNINTAGLEESIPVIYENIGSAIVTLTLLGGATLRNPPVLNGSATTAGLNPGETITFIKQADNTILAIY